MSNNTKKPKLIPSKKLTRVDKSNLMGPSVKKTNIYAFPPKVYYNMKKGAKR